MAYHAFWWLGAATPVWLTLCLIAAGAVLAWYLRSAVKRLDRHARSIAHMDEWADSVDQTLAQIEERSRRSYPPRTPAPSTAEIRKWWQK